MSNRITDDELQMLRGSYTSPSLIAKALEELLFRRMESLADKAMLAAEQAAHAITKDALDLVKWKAGADAERQGKAFEDEQTAHAATRAELEELRSRVEGPTSDQWRTAPRELE